MIDLNPGDPYNKVYVIVLVWIFSGLFGIAFRIWLATKYRQDLAFSSGIGAPQSRQSVSRRAISSTIIHIIVKLTIVAIGIWAVFRELGTPYLPPWQPDPITIGLVLIPWLLTFDGYLEFIHQRWLLQAPDLPTDIPYMHVPEQPEMPRP